MYSIVHEISAWLEFSMCLISIKAIRKNLNYLKYIYGYVLFYITQPKFEKYFTVIML